MIGVGSSRDGLGVGGGYQKSKSGVAKLTAPPVPDGSAGESIALIFLLIVEFGSSWAVFFHLIFHGNLYCYPGNYCDGYIRHIPLETESPENARRHTKAAMRRWEH